MVRIKATDKGKEVATDGEARRKQRQDRPGNKKRPPTPERDGFIRVYSEGDTSAYNTLNNTEPMPTNNRSKQARLKEIRKAKERVKKGTPEQMANRFLSISLVGTLFPHAPTLVSLGILNDVTEVMTRAGVGSLLGHSHTSYKTMTSWFLGSLEVWIVAEGGSDHPTGGGIIRFTDDARTRYTVSFRDISDIYGFSMHGNAYIHTRQECNKIVSEVIAEDHFRAGITKASTIRHPALRYIHKILANSLYCRREAGEIITDEMNLIRIGLHPLLCEYLSEGSEYKRRDPQEVNMVRVFCDALLEIQEKHWFGKDTQPQLAIGGWLTPLFQFVSAPLHGESAPPRFLDLLHLQKARLLLGEVEGRYVYSFTSIYGDSCCVLLPNSQITDLSESANLNFDIGEGDLYDPSAPDASFIPLGKNPRGKKKRVVRETEIEPDYVPAPEEQEDTPPIYGSARYYATPLPMPASPGPLRDLVKDNRRKGRWIKYLDIMLRNTVGENKWIRRRVRKQEEKLRRLEQELRRREVEAQRRRAVDNERFRKLANLFKKSTGIDAGIDEGPSGIVEEALTYSRRSTSAIPEAHEDRVPAPARASAWEHRGMHPIASPPAYDSDNEFPTYNSEEEFDPHFRWM